MTWKSVVVMLPALPVLDFVICVCMLSEDLCLLLVFRVWVLEVLPPFPRPLLRGGRIHGGRSFSYAVLGWVVA